MRKEMLKVLGAIGLVVMVAALLLVGCAKPAPAPTPAPAPAPEPTLTLRFSNAFTPVDPMVIMVNEALDEIAAKSEGRIRFEKFYGKESGFGGREYIYALEQGLMDIGMIGIIWASNEYPWLDLTARPFILPDASLRGMAYKSVRPMMDDFFAEHGIIPLAYAQNFTASTMLYTTKEIKSLSDLKGLMIRASSVTLCRAVELLGATPVSLEMAEVYLALQKGTIDGAISGSSLAESFSWAEVAKYEMKLWASVSGLCIAASKQVWDKLSIDQQKIFRDTFSNFEDHVWSIVNDPAWEAEAYEYAISHGVTVYDKPSDIKAAAPSIREALVKDYLEKTGAEGKQALDLLEAALAKAGY